MSFPQAHTQPEEHAILPTQTRAEPADCLAVAETTRSPIGPLIADEAWVFETVHDGGDLFIVVGRVHTLGDVSGERPLHFYRGQYTGVEGSTMQRGETVPASWRYDLEAFSTSTPSDTWL